MRGMPLVPMRRRLILKVPLLRYCAPIPTRLSEVWARRSMSGSILRGLLMSLSFIPPVLHGRVCSDTVSAVSHVLHISWHTRSVSMCVVACS